jgi:uncharacterized protein YcbX
VSRPAGPEVAALWFYPVKGCAGIEVPAGAALEIGARGPAFDREWMVVDAAGRFVTQRDEPRLARVRCALQAGALVLDAPGAAPLRVPLAAAGEARRVQCWAAACDALDQGEAAARWLGEFLGAPRRLVRMAPGFERVVNPERSPQRATTAFTDGYPFLVIGEASLADLNRRLAAPLPMNRFRPNLVVRGSEPYAEDGWRRIRVGRLEIEIVKPCDRCAVTTTDQATGERGPEPLATLARYRRVPEGVLFGQNGVHRGTGALRVGDPIEVLKTGPPPAFVS